MCLICTDIQKNKLTSIEARNNLEETHRTLDREHIHKILRLIWRKEDKEWEDATDVGSD